MKVIRYISRRFFRRTTAVVLAFTLIILFGDKLASYTAKMIYPIKYQTEVEQYSKSYEVSPSLCYAVIKCESNFNPDAKSDAGAQGLMQLTPDTFDFVANNLYPHTTLTDEAVFKPHQNIECGIWLLSYLQEQLEGEEEVLAAYNAGLNQVKDWLSYSEFSYDGTTLKKIPYKETDEYVKKVLKVKKIYRELYNME